MRQENSKSMTSASIAIFAAKLLPQTSNATRMADIPTFTNNPKRPRKRLSARKPWKAAPSKPSATTQPKPSSGIDFSKDPHSMRVRVFFL